MVSRILKLYCILFFRCGILLRKKMFHDCVVAVSMTTGCSKDLGFRVLPGQVAKYAV